MTLQEINKAYSRIIGSLDCRELKSAFDFLQSLMAGSRQYAFQDKLDELQETYKYMLRYRCEGAKDPMQEQIYNTLTASVYELADRVKHQAMAIESSLHYYSRRRNMQFQPAGYTELYCAATSEPGRVPDEVGREAALTALFGKIWVSDALTSEEVAELRAMLLDPALPPLVGCQIVSALMMALQAAFDKERLLLLFDAASLPNEEIHTRALIGILLTLGKYRKRTALYPQVANRLEALAESFVGFTKAMRTILLRFILARETEKISRRLQDEIIPEMMKLSPKLSKKINLKDFSPEQLGEEMNPEWQTALTEGELGKKMAEFSELQQEGADLMHSTFIHLKNFPFFREPINWFLPFTAGHSSFSALFTPGGTERDLLETMASAGFMCNSDKYSFYLSVMQLPETHRKAMMGQFGSQANEMIQQGREELITRRDRLDSLAGQYIQDLYRFFKLYPGHLDFDDIFAFPIDYHNLPILRPYLSDEESRTVIAEYYLRKNYFADALGIYNQLADQARDSAILFQKIGYCKQMNDDLEGALAAYLRADLLNTESKWVIRRIAACYRTLKQPEAALTYYRRYETLSPDNLSVLISIGHCHLELKNYSEALKCYFKVDYLDSKSHKAWRPIAWCSFLTGRYDQARNYYAKIRELQPNTQDLLNAGHTEWALQNIKGSLACYAEAVRSEGNDYAKFHDLFLQDLPDLLNAGIEEQEIPLMLDQLRYQLEE